MPVRNQEIAAAFQKLADLLEIQGANQFRVRAYRNAALTIESHPKSMADMIAEGEDLQELPGIGRDLAAKIREYVETGRIRKLDELTSEVPEGLSILMKIEGLGPKKVKTLHERLGISSRQDLEAALHNGEIARIRGFGPKTEQKIIQGLSAYSAHSTRVKFITAHEIAQAYLEHLNDLNVVKKAIVAGSYRRKKETVGDLDILVICEKPELVMDRFAEEVGMVVPRTSVRRCLSRASRGHRVVPESYGAACTIHRVEGTRHCCAEDRAEKQAEDQRYGVFRGRERIAGGQEGLSQRWPALYRTRAQENRGRDRSRGRVPCRLINQRISGEISTHTILSDGRNALK